LVRNKRPKDVENINASITVSNAAMIIRACESISALILRSIGEADASRRMAAKYGPVAILRDAALGSASARLSARLLRMRVGDRFTSSSG
jgi:hypothetical protein